MSSKVTPLPGSSCPRDELFRSLKTITRLYGFYLEYDDDRRKRVCVRVLMILYCVFCNMCAILSAIRLPLSQVLNKGTGSVFVSFPYFLFFISIALVSITSSIAIPRIFPKFIDQFTTLRTRYNGNDKHLRKLKWIACIMAVCYPLFIFVTNIVHVFLLDSVDISAMRRFNYPWDQFKFGWVLQIIVSCFGSPSIFVMQALFNLLSYCIYKEYAHFAEKFKQTFMGDPMVFERGFSDLWDEYVMISDVFKEAHALLKHFIAITLFLSLPMLCMEIFALIKGKLTSGELGFVSGIFVLGFLIMANITIVCVFINNKAHEPLQFVYDAKWMKLSGDSMHKLSLFVSKLSGNKLGYSVYDLFIIDKSTITMLFGTFVTYTVVVLQF